MATRPPRRHVPVTFIHQREPFPYPATTLVIVQHLFVSRCGQYWAWRITGTFYDVRGGPVWWSEVCLAKTPEEDDGEGSESDEESSETSSTDDPWEDVSGEESGEESLASTSVPPRESARTGGARGEGVHGAHHRSGRGESAH